MSLARSLQRSSRLVRLRRAQTAGVCSLGIAGCASWLSGHGGASHVLGACLLAGGVAALWPVELARIARALDDANQLEGRLVAAHEFAGAGQRTPFMDAALRDADVRATSLRGVLPRGLPWWLQLLAPIPLLLAMTTRNPTYRAEPALPIAVPTREAPARERAPEQSVRERAQALAELGAQQAQLTNREVARRAALQALMPVMRDVHGAVTATGMHALADAIAGAKLSSAARAQLRAALERARESERARLAEAQRGVARRDEERKLEQLTRPPDRPRALEQLTRPEQAEAESPSQQAEHEALAQQLARAADALGRGQDAEAARAMRDAADALARQQQETEQQQAELDQRRELLQRPPGDAEVRAQFERAAWGGGSEPDRGDHAPAERRIGGRYQDVRVRGIHGEGPSRSQVIEGTSQAGFASAPYRRVYADYRAHAEQLLERDDVPPGERFYVRRYFELVQPREVR